MPVQVDAFNHTQSKLPCQHDEITSRRRCTNWGELQLIERDFIEFLP